MKKLCISVICLSLCIALITANFVVTAKAQNSYMGIIHEYLETVLDVGRNVDGTPYPILFVDGINRTTREPVRWLQSGSVWAPANLASQQMLMRTLDAYSDVSGDKKYENIAKEQYQFYFDNLCDKNGLLYWGGHQWVDKYSGEIVGEQPMHEFKAHYPYYKLMFETDFEATKKFIEAHWNAHISDWSNLSFNRHGIYNNEMGELWDSEYVKPEPFYESDEKNLSFITAGSDLIYSAMMLYKETGDERPRMWAKRLFKQYMDCRDPVTKLGAYQFSQLNKAAGGDRTQAQYGPEFGESAYEGKIVQGGTANNTYGPAMLTFMYVSEMSGDKEILNDTLDCLRAWATYVYNPETNLCEPMFSDGTSLLGFVTQRDGFQGSKGKVWDYYSPNTRVVLSFCTGSRLSNGDAKIWEATRGLMRGFGLGDIGTAPGQNIAVDLNTKVDDPILAMAAVELYKFTRSPQYLSIAERICENIINYRFKDGLFSSSHSKENVKLSAIEPLALIAVEAARQGKFDAVDYLCIGEGYIHGPYDGFGRSYDSAAIYSNEYVPVESVSVNESSIKIIAGASDRAMLSDIENHWAKDVIRLMNSRGVMQGTPSGFEPDRPITRAEFVVLLNRLCSIEKQAYQGCFYDVTAQEWFAEDVQAAFTEGIIDPNLYKSGGFLPNQPLTREEMAALLAKTMVKKLGYKYYYSDYISRYYDINEISAWAENYVDICANSGIMQGMQENLFAPHTNATRAQVCTVLERLDKRIEKPLVPRITATVFPENASDKRITYESSNTDVAVVDSCGYVYGVAPGTANILVKASDKSYNVAVEVLPNEEWMLSAIYADGVLLEGFDTFKHEYALDLVKGTTQPPVITAKKTNGEAADVAGIRSIPGTVTIGNGEKQYTVVVTANGINYAVNEDFSTYELDTPINLQMNKGWQMKTNSYGGKGKTTQVSVITHPKDKTKKCILLDAQNMAPQLEVRATFLENVFELGETADEDYLAYELSFMQDSVGADASKKNSIMLYDEQNGRPVARFQIGGSSIVFSGEGQAVNVGTLTANEFHRVKAVIDKRQRTVDVYYDDKAIATNVLMEKATSVISAGRIFVQVIDPDTGMYIDEMKVYTIPRSVYEVPEIEVTEETEQVGAVSSGLENPFTDDFSAYTVGAVINGNGIWTSKNDEVTVGLPPKGGSKKMGILFPEIVEDMSTDYTVNSKSFGIVTLGEAADEKNLVFEFEAMPGNDMYINLLSGDSGSNFAFRLFFQGKKSLVHCSYTPEGASNDKVIYDNLNSKRVYRIKVVINKEKMEADVYLNDSMLICEEPIYGNRYGQDITAQRIQISTRQGTASKPYASHSAGWFGNFNIYEEEQE